MSAKGRPEREYRSAQRGGHRLTAKGRPERLSAHCAVARSAKVVQ
jgi:hypothetical protein